jgi:ribonucleoside-diphosphate reductase alpha chain
VQGGAGDDHHARSVSAHGYASHGATALKGDIDDYEEESPATLAGVSFSAPETTAADKRAEARMKGYVGEACPECGNFTMVRNGTCLKCETCGGTTGCS